MAALGAPLPLLSDIRSGNSETVPKIVEQFSFFIDILFLCR